MDVELARSRLRSQHRAVMSTRRRDGTPQMSPVLATTDGTGRVTVSTTGSTAKLHNLRRHPRTWLCVLPDQFFGQWFQVEADVEIIELPDAMPLLEDYYRSISGEHEDWEVYRQSMRDEHRVALRLTLLRATASPSW